MACRTEDSDFILNANGRYRLEAIKPFGSLDIDSLWDLSARDLATIIKTIIK